MALALWWKRPFSARALLQLVPEKRRFERAVDDLPRKKSVGRPVPVQVGVRIEAGARHCRAPVSAVLFRQLDRVSHAPITEREEALVVGMPFRFDVEEHV